MSGQGAAGNAAGNQNANKKRWKNDYFFRQSSGRPFKIAGFDLETDGLGGKLLFATYYMEGEPNAEFIRGENIIDRLIAIMRRYPEYIWFAHNAGYDWRYFIDYFRNEPGVRYSLRNDNSIFSIRIPALVGDKMVIMRDSMAIWPKSLRELAQTFCPEFPKGEIDFNKVTFNPYDMSHIKYALRDAEILVHGIRRYDEIIHERYGVHLQATIASTAMRAWRHMLDKDEKYYNPKHLEGYIRDAYFGGLVFLTRDDDPGHCRTYDISSSYPDKMRRCGVPYGKVWACTGPDYDHPGIYDVTVDAGENISIPILPARGAKGTVLWPSGKFRTKVTSIELKFALERGYKLIEFHSGICFEKIIFPFNKFVDRAEETRRQFKGRPEEKVAKDIQNSLYGKFGARRERRSIVTWKEAEGKEGYVPWDDEASLFVKLERAEDMTVLPQWAVWITACGRLQLLETAYDKLGVENVIYGDTDSLTTTGNLETAKSYGSWQLEKEWISFRAIAPKVYCGRLNGPHRLKGKDLADGAWFGAAKGIPEKKQSQEVFEDMFYNDIVSVEMDFLPSFLVTLRGKSGTLKHISRKSTNVKNSRNWRKDGHRISPRPFPGLEDTG